MTWENVFISGLSCLHRWKSVSTSYRQSPNGAPISARLRASYRALEVRAHAGLPQWWQQYGLFGELFIATDLWGDSKKRVGLTPEELARLKPCQVMTRVERKAGDSHHNFFSLPVELTADGSVDEFCNAQFRQIPRVWSSYQTPLETWLIWCRLGSDKNSVIIRQCLVEPTVDDKGIPWFWRKKSEVESVTREVGTRHKVENLSFAIAELLVLDMHPKIAWVHIADPELETNN